MSRSDELQRVLVVDDDTSVTASLSLLLSQAGFLPLTAASPEEALNVLREEAVSAVIQDMNFSRSTSGEEGLELLDKVKGVAPNAPVILITAWGSISLAVQGVKAGAADFVTKPWDNDQLLRILTTAIQLAEPDDAPLPTRSREELDEEFDFSAIVGNDPAVLRMLETIGRVCKTDASVLILGESGTGKELVAEAIHQNSHRAEKNFVKVNLGGIATTLFESEMFGHVKGAFTDAHSDRTGRFAQADGGSIFLDEIGDLEAASQVKLLRVLQDRTYEVLGSSQTRRVDMRVISATNRDLHQAVQERNFREDLLYRLNLITLNVPPLRERSGDIPALANAFLRHAITAYRAPDCRIEDGAMQWLMRLEWPGNIRQLRQTIERAVLMSGRGVLRRDDFVDPALTGDSAGGLSLPVGKMTLDEIEIAMIRKSLDHFEGNLTHVAEALGISRAALYRRLDKHGIKT